MRDTFDAAVPHLHLKTPALAGEREESYDVALGSAGMYGLRLPSASPPDGEAGGLTIQLDITR